MDLRLEDAPFSGKKYGYRWWSKLDMVRKRIKLLLKKDLWSISRQYGTVIPDNFPTEYDLDATITMVKLYYMILR